MKIIIFHNNLKMFILFILLVALFFSTVVVLLRLATSMDVQVHVNQFGEYTVLCSCCVLGPKYYVRKFLRKFFDATITTKRVTFCLFKHVLDIFHKCTRQCKEYKCTRQSFSFITSFEWCFFSLWFSNFIRYIFVMFLM